MLTLILLAFTAQAPQAAYTARIYLPGKQPSHYAVYLWRGPKEGSERLATANGIADNLRWFARNTLEWDETVGEETKRVRFDLTTMKKSSVALRKPTEQYLVPPHGLSYENFEDKTFKWRFVDRQSAVIVTVDGRETRLPVESDAKFPVQVVRRPGSDEFFLATYMSGRGVFCDLWLVHSPTGRHALIARDLAEFEVHPDSRFWSGRTQYSEIGELAGMSLWIQKGFVGNWKTGEVWKVLPSPAYLTSISLRPPIKNDG